MENKENIQDKTDNYLLGSMSSEEMIAFEKEMAFSKELKESVELQKLIVSELKERASIFKLMKQVDKAEENGILIKLQSWKFYAMAATVLILITLVIWQPGKLSNDEIFKQYAMAVSSPSVTNARGNEIETTGCPFSNLYPEECRIVKQALQYYDKEQYAKAAELFIQVLDPPEKNEELTFFMAISQFKIADYNNAQVNFNILSQLKDFKYQGDVQYFQALIYIQAGNNFKARKILKNLSKHSEKYHDKAHDALKKLRWF